MNLHEHIFKILDEALSSGRYPVLLQWGVDRIISDLLVFDETLDAQPTSRLAPHVEEWLRDRRKRWPPR